MLRLPPLFAAPPSRCHRHHFGGAGASAATPQHPLYLHRRLLLTSPLSCAPSTSTTTSTSDPFDSELHRLLALLPSSMRSKLSSHPEFHSLIEVVMDLGRNPFARFPSGDFLLSDRSITLEDLRKAASQVGDFVGDNRAGISRTLHRISAIRNRKGAIVGLTCRVGRAVTGSADSIRDLVEHGESLLLIGPPGVGKTTIIREIARILADEYSKRVMIVDTSNEIGGDGDIPHSGIGDARRMQVPEPSMQHKVLIEAVENHMPQVIVIDEIGTKLEAMAASTIAQRGIQLVATAHGITIENLIMNPSLEMLVGGIQSVTLGDEEASRRRVQKTILERKGPSTFSCAVEIISKTELRVHRSLEATVDALLSGRAPKVESRSIYPTRPANRMDPTQSETKSNVSTCASDVLTVDDIPHGNDIKVGNSQYASELTEKMNSEEDQLVVRLFVYGILEASVKQAINQMRMEDVIVITEDVSEADAFLALHSKLKKNPRIEAVAKSHGIPIYVTKTNSLEHVTKAIRSLLGKLSHEAKEHESEDKISSAEKMDALEEARLAIEQIVIPKGEMVELLPRASNVLSAQMDLARQYNLKSVRVGRDPAAFLRILPLGSATNDQNYTKPDRAAAELLEQGYSSDMDYFRNGITRLPLLPE